MVRLSRLFVPAAPLGLLLLGAWPLLVGAQTQPEIAGILERLDRLERENRALAEEVRTLRAKLEGAPDSKPAPPVDAQTVPEAIPASSPVVPGATLEEKVEIAGQRIDEQAQTKVEASQKYPIRLAGMALFNAFMNSKQNGGTDFPVTASAPGPGRAGATLRQSIIGLEYRGPTAFLGGNIHGSVYMDFFTAGTNPAMRLRTGSIEIDWKTRSLMVGLEKPIFNPREPSSLAQVGVSPLTGAGNLWLWEPQVRFQQDIAFGRRTGVRAQVGVMQTHEANPYAGTSFTGTVEPIRPGLEGRFEFFHNLDDERRLEIAPGFHHSSTHVGRPSLLSNTVQSNIVSADWFFNPWRRVEFTGFFYAGRNVAPLGEGYQQGFGVYSSHIDVVSSRGGWGQLTIHTLPRLDFHFFSGQQDDRNSDLIAGGIGKNLVFGGNLYYHLSSNVILGLETTQLRTTIIGQRVRINNHYDLALAYLF